MIETIVGLLAMAFPLVFWNNLAMTVVKYLAGASKTKLWLRAILSVLSIFGVIAYSSITGDPVDFDRISSLGTLVVEALIVAFGAHFSYKAIKTA